VAAVLFPLGGFERGAEGAPQTGCNGFPIGVGQCAEPLRIPGIHTVAIFAGRTIDGGRGTGGAEIRYAYIVRPAPVLGTGDHDQP
jgi:hypothetical protein